MGGCRRFASDANAAHETGNQQRAESREQRAESVEIPFDGDSRGALAAGWLGETLRDYHVVNGCPIWQTIRGQPAMLRRRQGGRLEARGIQLVIEVDAIKAHRRKRFAFVIRNSYAQQLSKASSS